MKIAIPTQSISKSLFIAKRKDRDNLELLFYAPSSAGNIFYALDDTAFHFSDFNYRSPNVRDEIEQIYNISEFLPTLFAFIQEEKHKEDPDLFKEPFLSKLRPSQIEYYADYIDYIKSKRQALAGIVRFFNHFKALIENNEVSPVNFDDILTNVDEYQLAFGEALANKYWSETTSFVEVKTLLLSYFMEVSEDSHIPEISLEMTINKPRKSKPILRLNLFEKIRYYLGLL
jgi:hypothetical protein